MSKTQEGDAREKQTIIDQVSYENLLPGETYILKGVLMDKADGKEMTDKNQQKNHRQNNIYAGKTQQEQLK